MSTKNGNIIIKPVGLKNKPEDIGVTEVIPTLSIYHIFLAIEGPNLFTEEENQIRKYAATVVAKDLEDAFKLSQNDFSEEYAKHGLRSCSIGDLIQDNEGFYMVCASGFKLVCLLETGHD